MVDTLVLGTSAEAYEFESHSWYLHAAVAEQADAQDLKSCETYTLVPVRFWFAAFILWTCSSVGSST